MALDLAPLDISTAVQAARKAAADHAASRLRGEVTPAAVRQAAEDFEAVFLGQMLAPMFDGLESDALFGGGPGEDIYRSLLVEEYGKALARAGGVGLADAVQREILRLQETQQ